MILKSDIFVSLDLIELNLLPIGWEEEIFNISQNNSTQVHLDGTHITSREPKNTPGMDVYMVEGSIIKDQLNWLYMLYSNQILNFANQYFDGNFECSESLDSAITLNALRGKNSRYELHVDSNPMTGLLFATTHTEEDGGELLFVHNDKKIVVNPKSGTLLLFDGRGIPHTVLPLKNDSVRISIPMNYYFENQQQSEWFNQKT